MSFSEAIFIRAEEAVSKTGIALVSYTSAEEYSIEAIDIRFDVEPSDRTAILYKDI
jgi:hypothetical protein